MDDREIDKYFKAEREDETIAPPDFVWKGLENELRRNGRKRRYLLWLFFGFFCVSGLGYWMISNEEATEMFSAKSSLSTSNANGSEAVKMEDLESNKAVSEKDLEDESGMDEDASALNSQETKASNDSNISKYRNVEEQSNDGVQKSYSSNQSMKLQNVPLQQESVSNTQSNGELNIGQILDVEIGERNIEIAHQKNEGNTSKFASSVQMEMPSIGTLFHPLLTYKRDMEMPILEASPPIIKVNKNRNFIGLSTFFGKPNFQSTSNSEQQTAYETDWYSFGFGLSYQRELLHKLFFGIGLTFRQSKRKFEYKTNDLFLLDFMPNQTDNSFFEYGTITSQGEQRFSFFDLTLGIGYDISIGKLRVRPGLDALLNFKLITEGKTWNSEAGILRYVSSDKLYSSSMGLGVSPSVSLGFPFRRDVLLSFTPRYVTYFRDLENARTERTVTYSNFGAELGVRKQF